MINADRYVPFNTFSPINAGSYKQTAIPSLNLKAMEKHFFAPFTYFWRQSDSFELLKKLQGPEFLQTNHLHFDPALRKFHYELRNKFIN